MDFIVPLLFLLVVLFLTTIVTWGVTSIHNLESEKLQIQSRQESHQRTLRLFTEKLATVKETFEALDILASQIWEEINASSVGIYVLDSSVDPALKQVKGAACVGPFPIFSEMSIGIEDKIIENSRNRSAHFKKEVIRSGEGLLGEVIDTMTSANYGRSQQINLPRGIDTMMAVPLTFEGRFIGLIVAVNRKHSTEPYSNNDLEEFEGLSIQAALAASLILVYTERQKQDRIVQELASYSKMQKLLLPSIPSKLGVYRFAAYQTPAMEVSGDFYDFAELDENRVLVIVADAAGKNLPACLMTSMCRSFVRCLNDRFTDVESFLLDLNRLIHAHSDPSQFVTLNALLIDMSKHECKLGCAGHTPLLLRSASGELKVLKPAGHALGMWSNDESTRFEIISFNFEPGMKICLYSDGINESKNRAQELFGDGRFWKLFQECADSPKKTIARIIGEVKKFSEDMPQADDQTLMVISRRPLDA